MAIYAIGDLHLSFNNEKPMNIFGENWEKHKTFSFLYKRRRAACKAAGPPVFYALAPEAETQAPSGV